MVRVLVDGGLWQTLGAERERGIFPTAIAPSWDAWGSAALNFTLGRDPSIPQPDLTAFTPIEYLPYGDVGGLAWGGYIMDTPPAGDAGLSVSAKGWQYALDDDPYTDAYVHEDLSTWQDLRGFPGAALYNGANGWSAAGDVASGSGEIVLSRPQGTVIKPDSAHGVILDLGPLGRGAKAVSIDVSIPSGWSLAYNIYVRATDTPTGVHGGPTFHDGGLPVAPAVGVNTYTPIYDRPYRYVMIFLHCPGGGTTTVEELMKITGVRVFTSDAYRSAGFGAAGGSSVLKASQVWANALTKVPVLDQDASLIAQTVFTLRAYGGVKTERTARADIEQSNAYHRFLTRVRADRRLEVLQRLTYPTLEANTRRRGVDWQDATVSSGEDVYNAVTVKGRSGSGAELAVRRLSADVGISNILDRRGRVRSKTLEVAAPTDPAIMAALGDAWLSRYARTPLKGTLTITGDDALRELPLSGTTAITRAGGPIPAGLAGARTGEAVLLSNLMDLDTGERGRVAITAAATYAEDTDVATIAIDNTRDDFEALLARMGVVAGA